VATAVNIRNKVNNLLAYSREELITLNLFWIGFLFYTLAATIVSTRQVSFILFQVIQLLGILLFLTAIVRLIRFEFSSQYQKNVFCLLAFWSLIIFVRGFSLEKDAIKMMILDSWFGAFLYFVPWVMLLPQKLILYKKVFSVIVILGIFYIVYSFLFISDLMEPEDNVLSRDIVEYFSKNLAVPVIFLLLTYAYHTPKRKLFAAGVLALCIFFALVRARRGLLFMSVGSIFFIFIIFWINTKYKILTSIFFGIFIVFLGSVFVYLFEYSDSEFIGFLQQRGAEDTRGGVEQYFYKDMVGLDWIVGRGMAGEYYSPTIADGNLRGTIETDYLNMILKGGLIQLILLLMILLPAVYKGLFQSRNNLSKAAALWILIWLINTHPSTVQVYSLFYLLVWISVGICYSDTIRKLSEKGLVAYFKS
jgi:hypothetical protein